MADRGVLTDDGVLLAARVDGPPDAPATAVLAHGWTQSTAAWDAVAALLAGRGLRVVRWDQRDHGRSRAVLRRGGATPASVRRLGDDMAAVVDALAPSGPLVLAGHSMGGMTTMALAGRRPDLLARARGVALVSTAVHEVVPRPRGRRDVAMVAAPHVMRLLAAAPAGLRMPRSPAARTRRRLLGPRAEERLVREARRTTALTSARSVGTWFAALAALDETEALAAMAHVPVLVLVGDHDLVTPVRHSRRIADAVAGAALEVVPGTGHLLPMERPDLVAERLAALAAGAASGGAPQPG